MIIVSTKSMSFEESLEKLELIVDKLESGEETLENTLSLYEEGIKISKNCRKILDKAKQKVIVLKKDCE